MINDKNYYLSYPSLNGNQLADGKVHEIMPLKMERFYVEGREYYFLFYNDITMSSNDCITVLTRENNNIVKVPFVNYDNMEWLYELAERENVSLEILPNFINHITPIKINDLTSKMPLKGPEVQNILFQDDNRPTLRGPIVARKYPAYDIGNNNYYIPRVIFDSYLTNRYQTLPRTTVIDNQDYILVTQEDINYITEVTYGALVPDYRQWRHLIDKEPPRYPADDYESLNFDDGYLMDYPDNNQYADLSNNPLWDGRTHEIEPRELYSFSIDGIPYYVMNYRDIDFDRECFALLSRNENDEIVKIPVDDYERLENIIDSSILTTEDLNILPHHIHLGEMLYLNESLGTMGNDRNTSTNISDDKVDNINNSKDKKIEKFQDKQALFTVHRNENNELSVTKEEYDFYLSKYLGEDNHRIINDKVFITEKEIEYVYKNSKDPELMPEYKLEIKMSIEQDDYPGLSFTTFKVYRTDKNLEIDKDTYNMLLNRNLIEKRDTISDRIAITKEEIEKIEKESSKPRLFADLINEKQLQPNVAFTVYNINGERLRVNVNIYNRYIRQYLKHDENSNDPYNRNELLGDIRSVTEDHLIDITEEELRKIEKESHDPKLTPTILYKKLELKDIYDNDGDTPSKGNDNGEDNKNNKPPIKKKSKVKKVIDDTKEWAKKHPVLAVIALGLAIGLTSQIALGGVMMLNSTLWSVLGGKGAICSSLHGINLALSKVVGLGAFKFTEAGTYALGGKAGALALYSSVGAKLTTALLGLTGIGKLAQVIRNKISKNREEKQEKSNEGTPLTREQIAELIKNEVDKSTKDLKEENRRLLEENAELKAQIQELMNNQERIR